MMKHRWVFLIVVLQVALMSIAVAQQAPFDTVIRGGRLLDGTGAPWIRADIAIRGDRIAAIGGLDGVAARRTIDARNRIVAPGFIDMHSHSDFITGGWPCPKQNSPGRYDRGHRRN